MNNTLFPEFQALRIELSDEVRDAQFVAIVAALESSPPQPETLVKRVKSAWRRWLVTAAAVGTALVPVAAVASDSAVPGDLLYPIKRSVERVLLVFDRDIDAEHRVDELETLVDGDADVVVVERHIAETLDVLGDTSDRVDLVDRVDDALARFRTDRIPETADDSIIEPPDTNQQSDEGTTTTIAGDRPADEPADRILPDDNPDAETTTTDAGTADPTTTTTQARDGDDDRGSATDDGESDRGDAP